MRGKGEARACTQEASCPAVPARERRAHLTADILPGNTCHSLSDWTTSCFFTSSHPHWLLFKSKTTAFNNRFPSALFLDGPTISPTSPSAVALACTLCGVATFFRPRIRETVTRQSPTLDADFCPALRWCLMSQGSSCRSQPSPRLR